MKGLLGMFLLIYGSAAAAYPYFGWYLSIGWKLKEAEPSDSALQLQRLGGMLAVMVGFVILVSYCSNDVQ